MPSQEQSAAVGGQMLTFRLGDETYGVEILRVKELRGWSPVTRLPQSAPHVLGVLNLRGAVVPIIDLRVRFALPSVEFSPLTVIIVLSLRTAQGVRECGIVVDSVSDVVDIEAQAIKPAPQFGNARAQDFVSGIATVEDQMLIVLNVDDLVGRDLAPNSLVAAA